MFKTVFIFFIVLTSLSFFKIAFIPLGVINFLELIVPAIMLFVIVAYKIYDNSFSFTHKFRVEFGLITVAVILSMASAFYFHNQAMSITAVTQRFIYFILIYPLLHVLKPKPEELIKLIIIFGSAFIVFYLLQTAVYPTVIFSGRISHDRGTLRIFLPGTGYLVMLYLLGLFLFLRTYAVKYIILCGLALIIFVLQGTRQVLGPVAISTLLGIMFSRKVKSRAISILLIVLLAMSTFFLFRDIYTSMLTLSQHQATNYQEDNRYRAAMFFLYDTFPNTLTYLIGNGVPSALSPYGIHINKLKALFGYYQSDIGIIGDYSKFGILLVIAQISIYIRVMFMRLSMNYDFIKYFFLILILTMFLGGGAFSNTESIAVLCVSLYIIDVSSEQKSIPSMEPPDGKTTSIPDLQ
jgi:hypothetical protein